MSARTWLHDVRLRAEIGLWRHGWGTLVLVTLAGVAGGAFVLQGLWAQAAFDAGQRMTQLTTELQKARLQAPAAPQATPEQERLASLRSVLYARDEVTSLVRDVFTRAQRHGLAVQETDFRLTTQGFAGLQQQQLVLPVQGTYLSFRAFVLEVLRSHPGVSVDQIQIKRLGVSQNEPEIRVRLSIWIDPEKRSTAQEDAKESGQ